MHPDDKTRRPGVRGRTDLPLIVWLITVITCAATCSVEATINQNKPANDSRNHGGILRADLGLFLKELGTVVATTDHVFINIAAEVPTMDLDIYSHGWTYEMYECSS